MKIQKTELANKLNKVKDIVTKRTTMPVLQGVLVKDGYLIANNLEMAVMAKLDGIENEYFIIPERAFDLINNLPEGEIEITVSDDYEMVISADKIKNKYQTLNPELFPINTVKGEKINFAVKSEVLINSIKRVSYAIPQQGKRSIMTAMCLQAKKGILNFVGLDGRLIAWDKVDYEGEFELLIPKDTVDKLKTIGLKGDVRITYSNSEAIFITNEFEIYTRLVEGKYYRYSEMFKELSLHTVVSRLDLLNAITRSKMCTEEKFPVYFEFKDNRLKISVKDNVTDYIEFVDVQENFSGELKIAFDARLIIKTLKSIDCYDIGISFEGSKDPIIIEADDSNFKALILPVAINN